MARLPRVGSDDGKWGNILNTYLSVTHDPDGSLKPISQSTIIDLEDDLAAKVADDDSRLSDQRVPTDSSVTNAKVSSTAAIDQSKIANLEDDLAAKADSTDLAGMLTAANNLSDLEDPAEAITNLGAEPAIAPGTFAQSLIPTAVKTAPYTAAPKDYVLTDASAGSVNHPLPTAPPDLTRIGYKVVAIAGANVVTFTCGGSDHINLPTGPTVGTLSLTNQAVILQYSASTAVWTVQTADLPLSQLDGRFAERAAGMGAISSFDTALRDNVTIGRNVVTIAADGIHNAFPGIVKVGNRLIAAYRNGTNHELTVGAVIKVVESDDMGRTWSLLSTISDASIDERDANLRVLSDGRIAMTGDQAIGAGTYQVTFRTSSDGGVTWSAPSIVETTNSSCSAPVVELPGGELILPWYEVNGLNCRLSHSTDGGATWSRKSIILTQSLPVGTGTPLPNVGIFEPNVALLPNGNVLAHVRCTDNLIYQRTSTDGGATWGAIVNPSYGNAGRPFLLVLASGTIVSIHRDVNSTLAGKFAAVAHLSRDNGATWSATTPVLETAFDGVGSDPAMTYAAAVEVAPNLLGCIYGLQDSATHSNIRFRYLGDGLGISPLGDRLADEDSIFLGPDKWFVVSGTVTRTAYGSNVDAWAFVQLGALGTRIQIPSHWNRMKAEVIAFNPGANSGAVEWRLAAGSVNPGDNATTLSVNPFSLDTTVTVGAQNISSKDTIGNWIKVVGAPTATLLRVQRRGAPNDTLTGSYAFAGLRLTKLT